MHCSCDEASHKGASAIRSRDDCKIDQHNTTERMELERYVLEVAANDLHTDQAQDALGESRFTRRADTLDSDSLKIARITIVVV